MPHCLKTAGLVIGLLLIVLLQSTAQTPTTVLLGHVTDDATGKPLPFVSVYLNGTTRGTVTNEQGKFELKNVPLGTVDLVASFLGYQPFRQTLRLNLAQPRSVAFRLKPDNRMLAGVTVKARSTDRVWQRQFRRFRQQLLGTPFGDKCVITNSFSLSFSEQGGRLKASASEPLIIENQALGYRLYYDLQFFDGSHQKVYYGGSTRFEEMPAMDSQQAERYRRNRLRAYRGSLRHLMAALINGTQEQEGFLVYYEDMTKPMAREGEAPTLASAVHVYQRLIPVNADTLIRPGKLSFERRLEARRPLTILYTLATSAFSPYRDARYAYSQLTLPMGWMQLTTEGWITSPNRMEVTGTLADDRLSTMLPADWIPTDRTQPVNIGPGADSVRLAPLAPVITQGRLKPADARSQRIAQAFDQQFKNPAPAVFVHTDKPLYLTGDRLWFSAYLLDGGTNRTPIGETAMQVDLLAPSGRVVQHQWLYVSDGRSVGTFRLSDTLSSGRYWLRGYTDEDDGQHRPAFERPVLVYNMVKPNNPSVSNLHLIAGHTKAAISTPADSTGLTLAADMAQDTNRLAVRVGGGNQQKPDSAYLLVQQRGQVVDQRKVILKNGAAVFSLSLLNIPPGLTELRLYDAAARLQATRVIYIPERLPPVQVVFTMNKPRYQPREMVTLVMNLVDDGQPVVAALSASITDADQVADDTAAADIQTHLRLTGELRGRICNPAAYFGGRHLTMRGALDSLLQTEVWRRVRGSAGTEVLGGVSVKGRILDPAGKPMPGTQIMLASTRASDSFMRTAGADEHGRFRLAGLAIADTMPVLVQLTDHQFKNLPAGKARLVLERTGAAWLRTEADTSVNWAAVSRQLLAAQKRQEARPDLYRDRSVQQLNEVTVRARRQDIVPESIQRARLHSGADAVVKIEGNVTQYANLYEMLRQVPGVSVRQESSVEAGSGYSVIIRGIGTFVGSDSKGGATQPAYLLDGTPLMGDPSTVLLNLNVKDIERIEVLKNAGAAGTYGVRGGNGVISLYSKRGGSASAPQAPKTGSQVLQLIGYPSAPLSFSLPRYESDTQPATDEASIDRRDVLYWKPIIQTDTQGRTQLMFPLSDVVRTLRISVQGITQDGRPVSAVKLIWVQ